MYRPIEFDGVKYFCIECGEIFGELDSNCCRTMEQNMLK